MVGGETRKIGFALPAILDRASRFPKMFPTHPRASLAAFIVS